MINRPFFLPRRWASLLFPLCLLVGCGIYDPEVRIPAYVQVNQVSFSTSPDTNGYNTANISEVWLFVNNQALGAYTVPTGKIPVLAEGNATVSISPGVYADGVLANKVLYPFYSQYAVQAVLTKEQTHVFSPHFTYEKGLKKPFTYYQDFELADTGFSKGTGTVPLDIQPHNDPSLEAAMGKKYGILTTTTATDIIAYQNDKYVKLRQDGGPVYLEFDYKSTCEVAVGLTDRDLTGISSDLVLRPSATWVKIYASLSEEAQQSFPSGSGFRFFFRTILPPGAGHTLMLDNIRLIN